MANIITNVTSVGTAFAGWLTSILAVFTESDILQLVLGLSIVGIVVSVGMYIVRSLKA